MMKDLRKEAAIEWLKSLWNVESITLTPASTDASFRRYFRLQLPEKPSMILMDSPPDKEDCRPFLDVAERLRATDVCVPDIIAKDAERGYLLLSDLGTQTYLHALTPETDYGLAHRLMTQAFDTLIQIQKGTNTHGLPLYEAALLRRELDLFVDWYLIGHHQITLSPDETSVIEEIFETLIQQILSQPTVFTHRDYMVRNLMVGEEKPGVLDFQDAVLGPITYDCASLLQDAFISFDEELTLDWLIRYREKAQKEQLPMGDDIAAFHQDYEWMSLQRHLKVIGIFCRLNYRDNRTHYLSELPRFSGYIRRTCERYAPFRPLLKILDRAEK